MPPSVSSAVLPRGRAATSASFCPNCGQPVQAEASFCPSCGYSIPSKPAAGAKSKLTAGLLGIFLGGLGIHNFYLGFTGKAVAQIVVSVFTCGAGSLWGFIEGILILCGNMNKDAEGNLLGE